MTSQWLQMSNYFHFLKLLWPFTDSVQCQTSLTGGKMKEGRGRLLLQIKCPGGNSNLISFHEMKLSLNTPFVAAWRKPNNRQLFKWSATEPVLAEPLSKVSNCTDIFAHSWVPLLWTESHQPSQQCQCRQRSSSAVRSFFHLTVQHGVVIIGLR